mmetsp:Transcript_7879/g.25737  ORF Transcript_7879/g.25737 Transcript_7879/m.25737 type:complete len:241 (-) Transcript_7879:1624-2346(-)
MFPDSSTETRSSLHAKHNAASAWKCSSSCALSAARGWETERGADSASGSVSSLCRKAAKMDFCFFFFFRGGGIGGGAKSQPHRSTAPDAVDRRSTVGWPFETSAENASKHARTTLRFVESAARGRSAPQEMRTWAFMASASTMASSKQLKGSTIRQTRTQPSASTATRPLPWSLKLKETTAAPRTSVAVEANKSSSPFFTVYSSFFTVYSPFDSPLDSESSPLDSPPPSSDAAGVGRAPA